MAIFAFVQEVLLIFYSTIQRRHFNKSNWQPKKRKSGKTSGIWVAPRVSLANRTRSCTWMCSHPGPGCSLPLPPPPRLRRDLVMSCHVCRMPFLVRFVRGVWIYFSLSSIAIQAFASRTWKKLSPYHDFDRVGLIYSPVEVVFKRGPGDGWALLKVMVNQKLYDNDYMTQSQMLENLVGNGFHFSC